MSTRMQQTCNKTQERASPGPDQTHLDWQRPRNDDYEKEGHEIGKVRELHKGNIDETVAGP